MPTHSTELENLLRHILKESYHDHGGLVLKTDYKSIFESAPEYSDPSTFISFSASDSGPTDAPANSAQRLYRNLISDLYLDSGTSNYQDELKSYETSESYSIDQRRITFRQSTEAIKESPKKNSRQEIENYREQTHNKWNRIKTKWLEALYKRLDDIGLGGRNPYFEMKTGLNLDQLRASASSFLNQTEYVYKDLLRWFLKKKLGLDIKSAKNHDLICLLNSFELEGQFPNTRAAAFIAKFLDPLFIDSENITIDDAKRSNKIPKPVSFPLDPPSQIIMSIYPQNGIEFYESLLSSLGTSLCYSFANKDYAYLNRVLRDGLVLSTIGELLQDLAYKPLWLKKYMHLDLQKDFKNFLYLRKLARVRSTAGHLLYELTLNSDIDPDSSARYVEMMGQATLCQCNEFDYLIEIDKDIAPAYKFAGMQLSAVMHKVLKESFDEQWWRTPEAGTYLKNIWDKGGDYGISDLLDALDIDRPKIDPVVNTFEEVLG